MAAALHELANNWLLVGRLVVEAQDGRESGQADSHSVRRCLVSVHSEVLVGVHVDSQSSLQHSGETAGLPEGY